MSRSLAGAVRTAADERSAVARLPGPAYPFADVTCALARDRATPT